MLTFRGPKPEQWDGANRISPQGSRKWSLLVKAVYRVQRSWQDITFAPDRVINS